MNFWDFLKWFFEDERRTFLLFAVLCAAMLFGFLTTLAIVGVK